MEWDRLISDYMDDLLTPEDTAALFQWIRRHPDNARQFARAAFLHRCLRHRLTAMRVLEEGAAPADAPDGPSAARPALLPDAQADADAPAGSSRQARPERMRAAWARPEVWGAAAAILVVLAVLAFLARPSAPPARLAASDNAVWAAGTAAPAAGGRLPRGELALDSGRITLAFDNGNRLVIEGPARFAVTGPLALSFARGSLTATVSKAGAGLTITTPSAQVTDLGTEFTVHASDAATRVTVYSGRVVVASTAPNGGRRELAGGTAAEVSARGITPTPFDAAAARRPLPAGLRRLDLIDLLAGGDGTGDAAGVGIDAATGGARDTAVTIRRGDRRFVRLADHPVLDGCFIPGGRMPVDSAGHLFPFPATTLVSYGLIWAGPNVPWEGDRFIATALPDDPAPPTPRVLVMHSNNGITLNLDAVRALHTAAHITGFRARVGNSYRASDPAVGPVQPLASVHLVVDGAARAEKLAFANVDPPFEVACALADDDHFLTLATTDGGDGNPCDWVLWTEPQFLLGPPRP